MPSLAQSERSQAERRFPPHQRCLDWAELWGAYISVLGEDRPSMAYVRDPETQLITPHCRNLAR